MGKAGDDIRIDWGYLYVAAPKTSGAIAKFVDWSEGLSAFANEGTGQLNSLQKGATAAKDWPRANEMAAALEFSLGLVGEQPVSQYVLLAYDDLYSIEFMRNKLRPYWRKDGWEAADLISSAVSEYDSLVRRCRALIPS